MKQAIRQGKLGHLYNEVIYNQILILTDTEDAHIKNKRNMV